MTDLLLAKRKLSTEHIDLAVGEAAVVKQSLAKYFDIYEVPRLSIEDLEYPDPAGYAPLVELLQDKYGGQIVITNGAKQGLGASFYSLLKMGKQSIGLETPYWCLFHPLMKAHGISNCITGEKREHAKAQLAVSPNNPDNYVLSVAQIENLKGLGVPIIHDAVYNSHIYLPPDQQLHQFGNVRLYSASKNFGLSGLRIGWVACDDPDFYALVREYVEMMTVGVSIASQKAVYGLLRAMQEKPEQQLAFEADARQALKQAKQTLTKVNSSVLDIPKDLPEHPGMFAFVRCMRPEVLQEAKISVPDGKHFGKEGYIRINLAVEAKVLQEAVERINRCPL